MKNNGNLSEFRVVQILNKTDFDRTEAPVDKLPRSNSSLVNGLN